VGPVLDLGVGYGLPRQPGVDHGLAHQHLAEQPQGGGGLPAPGPPGQGEEATAGVDPDAHEAGQHLGVVGDDPQVGGQHQVRAGAHDGPAHRPHDGHGQLPDPVERLVDQAHRRVLGLARLVDGGVEEGAVGARAERAVGAPHDGGADRGVGVDLLAGRDQVGRQGGVEGVAKAGVGHGDGGHAVGAVDLDGHRGSFRSFCVRVCPFATSTRTRFGWSG
jgi:hypothetical protein